MVWFVKHANPPRTPWTPLEDKEKISRFYDESPQKLGELSSKEFIHNMEWRLYTEYCFNSTWSEHNFYDGSTYRNWVKDETHYALERVGYKWDENRGRFIDSKDFNMKYAAMRDQVLGAVAKRSVEFLGKCREFQWPLDDNTENLRMSLEAYL
jgi:hypothetical protein